MYQIGEQLVYGIHGVCRVTDLEKRTTSGATAVYLVLEPVGQSGSKFYIPTHNPVAMAKLSSILTREQMLELFASDEVREDGWVRDESQRKQHYRNLIASGDRKKLLQMVCTLYRHKQTQVSAGRKVHACDENFLRDAEKLLVSEVAVVLNMEWEAARSYLKEKLKEDA